MREKLTMSLLVHEWQDFVIFPKDPDRIKAREERLALALQEEGGFVVKKDLLVRPGDEFEAMRVSELGDVEVWTRKKVWALLRKHGMEKLFFVSRQPYDAPWYD